MNKAIIRQSLAFEYEQPTPSSIKQLTKLALSYQEENDVYFLDVKRGKKVSIVNEEEFFLFLSSSQNISVNCFADLHNLLSAQSRRENLQAGGDSKSSFIKIFDNVIIVKKRGEVSRLFQESDLKTLAEVDSFVAVENGETFLNIDKYADYFDCENFIYISGYASSLTRRFLASKDVVFFVDYDIEGMNIYESFECREKSLHIPSDLEEYFKNEKYNNIALYKKQRFKLKEHYSKELNPVLDLIKKYNTVVEQEIIYEAF